MPITLRIRRRTETTTNNLYKTAADDGVEIICAELPQCVSVSVMARKRFYIGIDPLELETEADERVHLAHELGHCITGSFYNVYSELDVRAKHERRADRWAIESLVPFDDLLDAFSQGIVEPWEIAEHFTVTEEYAVKALRHYFE